MIELIFTAEIGIGLVALLWSYDRYAKRWVATRGNDVVIGSVNDVGYVAGEGVAASSFPMAIQSMESVITVRLILPYLRK